MSASLPPRVSSEIDPNKGYLNLTMHWEPKPTDPDPQRPGQKRAITRYIAAEVNAPCLCGSGKTYRECCRVRPVWHPIAPNPDGSFSLIAPQIATYHPVDGAVLRERLMADKRLYCTVAEPQDTFWLYWGDPPTQDELGTLCYADLELKNNDTLIVTAMTAARMETMLDLFNEIAAEVLPMPQIKFEQVPVLNKRTRQSQSIAPVAPLPKTTRPPINRTKRKK